MAIETHCPNGHRIRVKDHLAGRTGRCPTCGAKVRIEAAEQLPLARLVPLAPEVVATLPRARPLGAGRRPAADGQSWQVVEADVAAAADSMPDVADRELERIEPLPAAGGTDDGGPQPALHAVIAERPDATWCIAFPGGDPTEPLDAATMQAWLDGGHATGTEVVWRSDWPEWRPVQDAFPDFFGGGVRF